MRPETFRDFHALVGPRFAAKMLLLWLVLLAPAIPVQASPVAVSVAIPLSYIEQKLAVQVFTEPDRSARIFDDGKGCSFFVLSRPEVYAADPDLRILSEGKGQLGTILGDGCLVLFSWSGSVEVLLRPEIPEEGTSLKLEVTDTQLFEPDGSKGLVTGKLWDLVKNRFHPRFSDFRVDLVPALEQLREFLSTLFPGEPPPQTEALLDSVRFRDALVRAPHLVAELAFDVPAGLPPSSVSEGPPLVEAEPEPPLAPDELARWSRRLDQWDAFLTNLLVEVAGSADDAQLRLSLLAVLLDARTRIDEILAEPVASPQDPVRRLFVEVWKDLAQPLGEITRRLPMDSVLHYVTFIAAADALELIDGLGPQVNLEVSADGLRRMARMLAPEQTLDPLRLSPGVDPQLRRVFGFGDPLPSGEQPPAPPVSSYFFRPAWAGTRAEAKLTARLSNWAPEGAELATYLSLVRELLHLSADTILAGKDPGREFHTLFHNLVLAAAWQESCWRQFVREGKAVKPIESRAGSVGIMQVNQRVWRGFYDVKQLKKDVGYNARAGSEILDHYLADYAIKKGEHTKTKKVDNLARATYAMYNGGPKHMTRYRTKGTSKSLRAIDEAFWSKYRTIQSGNELAVADCFGMSPEAVKR